LLIATFNVLDIAYLSHTDIGLRAVYLLQMNAIAVSDVIDFSYII